VTIPEPAVKKAEYKFKKPTGKAKIALKNTKLKTSDFTWTSSDNTVATVGENTGKIKVTGPGSAVITGTYNGMTVTTTVTVMGGK
jgi:uncharacterized protein YjdB